MLQAQASNSTVGQLYNANRRRVYRERLNFASQWNGAMPYSYGYANVDSGVVGDDGRVYVEARRAPRVLPQGFPIGTVPTPQGRTNPQQILGMPTSTINFDAWIASALGTPFIAVLRPGEAVWGVADGAIGVAQLDPNFNVAQLWIYANGQAQQVASMTNRYPWTPAQRSIPGRSYRRGRVHHQGRVFENIAEGDLPAPSLGESWQMQGAEWRLVPSGPMRPRWEGGPRPGDSEDHGDRHGPGVRAGFSGAYRSNP